jgi:hypothetical protein
MLGTFRNTHPPISRISRGFFPLQSPSRLGSWHISLIKGHYGDPGKRSGKAGAYGVLSSFLFRCSVYLRMPNIPKVIFLKGIITANLHNNEDKECGLCA